MPNNNLEHIQSLLEQPNSKPDEALVLLNSMARGKNPPWQVMHYIGIAYLCKNESKTARKWLKKSIEAGDEEAATWHCISVCCFNSGDYEEAEEWEKQALEKESFFTAWMHLGAVYRAQGRPKDALKCYKKAVEIEPENDGIIKQIAGIYSDNGRIEKAIELFKSTESDEDDEQDIEAWYAIAQLLKKKLKFKQAEEYISKILKKKPDHLAANLLLSDIKREGGDYEGAVAICEHILEKNPTSRIRLNYALCMQELGEFDKAEKNYKRVLKDHPDFYQALSNYLMSIHYNPDQTKGNIFEAHKLWDRHFGPEEPPRRPVPDDKSPDRPLRIGLISGGFQKHPVGWMITKALEYLSEEYIIYCYSTENNHDFITNRISVAADSWRSVVGYDDSVIAKQIREDNIDILIELSGHGAGNRLRAIAEEPAPVIAKWVGGLFNTTGLKAVDYLITDRFESPEGEEPYYTEKLVRMPEDYITFHPAFYAPPVEPLPVKKNGYITFGCFNNPSKINDEILGHWVKIMEKQPHSQLLLKSKQYDTEMLRNRIIQKFQKEGIEEKRLIFKGQSSHKDHLSYYNKIDIALDPWPYSGGLTTCEALWMGVPVITKPGPTFAGKHSKTHLINAGFPDWVVGTWDEYITEALGLAGDIERLADLRSAMREQVADSPLCDGPRFAAHLGKALRTMWKQRVKGYENNTTEWNDHIQVEPCTEGEVAKIAGTSRIGKEVSTRKNPTNMTSEHGKSHNIFDGNIDEVKQKNLTESNQEKSDHQPSENGQTERTVSPQKVVQQAAFRIETADGLTICTPADLKVLTSYVLLEQEQWFEPELDFIREFLQPGMRAVDVGAGFGGYTLPMANIVSQNGCIYAFEPGSVANHHLEMSKLENGLNNIELSSKAVSDVAEKGKLHQAEIPELNRLTNDKGTAVAATTLDAWWKYVLEVPVNFIKLDVNGDEAKVLAGAEKVIAETSPIILVGVGEANTDEQEATIDKLYRYGYRLYEYVPGLQLLTEHEPQNYDAYLMNLVAIPEVRVQEFTDNGWIYNDQVQAKASQKESWKATLQSQPWAQSLPDDWPQKMDDEAGDYIRALNLLCAAENIDIDRAQNRINRSKKATLVLEAVQQLVVMYNNGDNSVEIAFTLARALHTIGQRSQAVGVLKKLMDENNFSNRDVNLSRPFLLPLPAQDHTAIKTNLKNWLTVRMVEAWISLKNPTTYFSGELEQQMLEMLKGNPEVSDKILTVPAPPQEENMACASEHGLKLSEDWDRTLFSLLLQSSPIEIKNHGLPSDLIVSVTSYPDRFDTLHLTLACLLNQTVAADRTILWIAHKDKDELPEKILKFRKAGLEIKYCEDIKSYKKIIPALHNTPDSFIVTADDDLYYKNNWLEELIESWDGNTKTIVAHRVHRIKFENNGELKPYREWGWEYAEDKNPSVYNFPTCGAGTLFPPHVFHEDVMKGAQFQKLAPTADDLWLYWMSRLNDAKIKVATHPHPLITWPSSTQNNLWHKNILEGKNDEQAQNLIEVYGLPVEKIIKKEQSNNGDNNFSGSQNYWKKRYERGGNSGSGSYGRLAKFKAETINTFVKQNKLTSFIEFGCGDGNQLSYMNLPAYLGYDVSSKAVKLCREKYQEDARKKFKNIEDYSGEKAECALSLDVVFHLVEDDVFERHMERLFESAEKFVVIYSSNKESLTLSPHVRHRLFSSWIEKNRDDWKLKEHLPNKYPYDGDNRNTSFCDFYIYEKETIDF